MRVKLAFFVVLVLVLVIPAGGGSRGINPSVERAVLRAIDNEVEAAARYEAAAAKAEAEGYPGVASLFRAAAEGEKTHALRFQHLLKSRGVEAEMPKAAEPVVWSTADNLRNAAAAEAGERDGVYKEAIRECKSAGDEDAAMVFDNTRDTEVEHGNLFASALRMMSSMKSEKDFYVCDICGYTTDVRLGLCPVCRANGGHVHEHH